VIEVEKQTRAKAGGWFEIERTLEGSFFVVWRSEHHD
jgi:hypothetical protein